MQAPDWYDFAPATEPRSEDRERKSHLNRPDIKRQVRPPKLTPIIRNGDSHTKKGGCKSKETGI